MEKGEAQGAGAPDLYPWGQILSPHETSTYHKTAAAYTYVFPMSRPDAIPISRYIQMDTIKKEVYKEQRKKRKKYVWTEIRQHIKDAKEHKREEERQAP